MFSVHTFRITGWALYLIGLGLYLWDIPIPGFIVMGLGAVATGAAILLRHRLILRQRAAPFEPLTPESARRAADVIRKRVSDPDPPQQPSPPSGPSRSS